MRKITLLIAILALALLIFINPSKINIFNFANENTNHIKEMNSIRINERSRYEQYNDVLCLINDEKFKIINIDGKEIYSQSLDVDNTEISTNKYIDVWNKNTNKAFSLNEDGQVIFSTIVSVESILYKSINEHVFIDILKSNDKEIIKIIDIGGEVNKRVEIDGNITHLKPIDDYILISYICASDNIENKIILIDANGNLKNETSFNDIILDIVYRDKFIYIIFENSVQILDNNLNNKDEIQIEGINKIEYNSKSNLYIKDSKNRWGYIDNKKFKTISTKGQDLKLELLDNTYLLYSSNIVYNNKLKQISKFNDNIKEINYIGKNFIAIIFEDKIKIYSID